AAAEGMAMAFRANRAKASTFRVDPDTHPQTIAVLRTRAQPIGIEIDIRPTTEPYGEGCFGALISYPASGGEVRDIKPEIEAVKAAGGLAIVASDLLALTTIESPGALGADMVLGSAQRFGVPFGYGGPHAAFFACRTAHQRAIPGRLVGVSQDSGGRMAYRLALQTREQHIRREKATSNICTAQVLLAVMAGFYGFWDGPGGGTPGAGPAPRPEASRRYQAQTALPAIMSRVMASSPSRSYSRSRSASSSALKSLVHRSGTSFGITPGADTAFSTSAIRCTIRRCSRPSARFICSVWK
ncbi:MAG: glycine dehydrogenase (aminomethyl-transferring), partial [Rhodospirillaceae bacterium TMED63]